MRITHPIPLFSMFSRLFFHWFCSCCSVKIFFNDIEIQIGQAGRQRKDRTGGGNLTSLPVAVVFPVAARYSTGTLSFFALCTPPLSLRLTCLSLFRSLANAPSPSGLTCQQLSRWTREVSLSLSLCPLAWLLTL